MDKKNTKQGFAHILILTGVAALIALIIGGSYFFKSSSSNKPIVFNQPINTSTQQTASSSASCGADCQSFINDRIGKLKLELRDFIKSEIAKNNQNAGAASTTLQPTPQATLPSVTLPKEFFVYLSAGGSTQNTNWQDVPASQFKFDPSNYPGAKAFYFQANLVSDAPDRTTYARLYDSTHSIGVAGSDINYTGLTSTFEESAKLNFFSGVLNLNVQIHSLNGNLATIQNPRIKITY